MTAAPGGAAARYSTPTAGETASSARPSQGVPVVVLVGNPNVGKTTLFNRLTGRQARVGNYPGITVERQSGKVSLPLHEAGSAASIELVDVPGSYSLSARSTEEQIAIQAVLGLDGNPRPELAVVVVDAGQLERNLYLVLQLAELGVPLVIALNMIDEVGDNPPDARAVGTLFGVRCVATSARKGTGTTELLAAIAAELHHPSQSTLAVPYPDSVKQDAARLFDVLPREWRAARERDLAVALWALLSVDEDDELTHVPEALRARCVEVRRSSADRDLDHQIIASRYALLDRETPGLYRRTETLRNKRKASERIDRVLLHPIYGFAAFLALMLVVFQSLFSWADPGITAIEGLVGLLQQLVDESLPQGFVRSLLSEGVIGGVGNVVVFLPQILLLFLFIGLLEDSGYMARVAYLMDRIMRSLGLHGRAFVPMLSGMACAVPAILATRTMERRRDRLLTMLVIPLMTCSARLPVYTLIIAALFPPSQLFGWLPVQGLLMIGMYVFSIVVTLAAAAVLGRTAVKGRRIPLILELPPYRMPAFRGVFKLMFQRSMVFLKEAGTVILVCTIALWALLSYPAPEVPADATPNQAAELRLEHSYGGRLGKAIEPALEPLGFDWKIGVGIIGAFAAREVFVSTMGVVYGIGGGDDAEGPLRDKLRAETRADGQPAYRPLTGLSLMVFFALACQCMSTLAVVRRETQSWRWPAFMFAYMTGLAYAASLLVFQIGRLLGF